jgi:hypothetical protein
VNFGVNFCVNFLRGFFHGFWTVDFGVDFCVNFLRGFLGWDSSPVDFTVDLSVDFFFTHCVDSLFKVQSWPVLVAVDFDVDFHRGFFYTQITRFYNDLSTKKLTLVFHSVFHGYRNDPQWWHPLWWILG